MIVKIKSGYKVVSHNTGKSFGTYKTKPQAVKRLKQVKFYSKKQ
jgi:hypothetical protein